MNFSSRSNYSNKFSPSVSKYKQTNAKHGVVQEQLPRVSITKCPTIAEDAKYHPVTLERSMILVKPIVEEETVTLVEPEPIFEAPVQSVISRVEEENVKMLIFEEETKPTIVADNNTDVTGLSLPNIYEKEKDVIPMQENPLRKFGRKISVKDTVSMVISHNRCRKYSETNGWNT